MSRWQKFLYALTWPTRAGKDEYRIETGHAGFIKLYKNGERIQPKNFEMEFWL